jgi:hypothetical protein
LRTCPTSGDAQDLDSKWRTARLLADSVLTAVSSADGKALRDANIAATIEFSRLNKLLNLSHLRHNRTWWCELFSSQAKKTRRRRFRPWTCVVGEVI